MRPLPPVVLSLLLLLLATAGAFAQLPDLSVSGSSAPFVAPGLGFPLTISYQNNPEVDSRGATITIFASTWINAAPDFCETDRNRAVCRVGAIRGAEHRTFEVEVLAHEQANREFDISLRIAADEGDWNPSNDTSVFTVKTFATFLVTNANDSGSGSLRAAIEAANAACRFGEPCTIAFRIPRSDAPWHTIALQSPLPVVTARRLAIDARTQTAFQGDTNPLGPEIELDGSALLTGDGLELLECGASAYGFAVNGFPGNGFKLAGDPAQCETTIVGRVVAHCYIGTDPTGTRAVPNHRGIAVDTFHVWRIEDNVISGNLRSGVFVEHGEVVVERNTIGMNAARSGPLPNGATGIYFDAGAGDVIDNYIAFNHHFGVAMSSRANHVALTGNSFQANWQTAIDYGLDGITTVSPEIIGVRYENGSTFIDIEIEQVDTFPGVVSVYANDAPDASGFGEGQYYLGVVPALQTELTFVHPGDLRGKWVAATQTRRRPNSIFSTHGTGPYFYTDTTEFSRAVEVK